MTATALTRHFEYNGTQLPDPNPELTPEQVQEFYATQYPELTNSHIQGPEPRGNKLVYSFSREFGSKG